ncbi:LysE/ArgO family amino acid transporter [Primorskyibacter sp. S187A]|uniref:LysE/ArgO family amino acid transporter n=1 Tax=Primorskyibacter sp. S187A TaxID=3415130 RepID=UPI003C7D45EC
MESALAGFALSLSLILAIGAQNAFVLRQGLRREHVGVIVVFCSLSEVLLISAGVAGFGALTRAVPWFEPAMRYGGGAFLLWYGINSLRAALRGGQSLEEASQGASSARAAILTLLGITWLNPHVYLDTVVLIGAVSSNYDAPWLFGAGAMAASILFFLILGYGARLLAPFFARPRAWQILDGIIGVTMCALAVKLVFFT